MNHTTRPRQISAGGLCPHRPDRRHPPGDHPEIEFDEREDHPARLFDPDYDADLDTPEDWRRAEQSVSFTVAR